MRCRTGCEPAGTGGRGARGVLGGEVVLLFADRACPGLDWAGGASTRSWSPAVATRSSRTARGGDPRRGVLAMLSAGRAGGAGPASSSPQRAPVAPPILPGPAQGTGDARAGVAVTGVTVHLVEERTAGRSLAQEAVPVLPGDETEDALLARIPTRSSTGCCRRAAGRAAGRCAPRWRRVIAAPRVDAAGAADARMPSPETRPAVPLGRERAGGALDAVSSPAGWGLRALAQRGPRRPPASRSRTSPRSPASRRCSGRVRHSSLGSTAAS